MVLSLTGSLTMVKKGQSILLIEKGQSILQMMKFPSSHSRLQTWAVGSMSKQLFLYAAAEQLLAFDQVSAEYLCSNSYFIFFRLSDCLPRFLTGIPFITRGISLIFAIQFST
jgi:hypothetical protein